MSEVAQVWGARIDWQQRSGLTVAECCETEGVSTAVSPDVYNKTHQPPVPEDGQSGPAMSSWRSTTFQEMHPISGNAPDFWQCQEFFTFCKSFT